MGSEVGPGVVACSAVAACPIRIKELVAQVKDKSNAMSGLHTKSRSWSLSIL